MKYIKSLILAFLLCVALPQQTLAQQTTQAQKILNQTASGLKNAGGIKASFQITASTGGKNSGKWSGTILLNGKKFKITTPDMITWFNGKTLWTYIKANEEVNVSEPTDDELQAINPYNFLYAYTKGYSCQMGTTTRFQNRNVHEIRLTATDKNKSFRQIHLIVDKGNGQPLQIKMLQGRNTWTTITLTSLVKNQKLAENVFNFNKKDAPHAEVIDLR